MKIRFKAESLAGPSPRRSKDRLAASYKEQLANLERKADLSGVPPEKTAFRQREAAILCGKLEELLQNP